MPHNLAGLLQPDMQLPVACAGPSNVARPSWPSSSPAGHLRLRQAPALQTAACAFAGSCATSSFSGAYSCCLCSAASAATTYIANMEFGGKCGSCATSKPVAEPVPAQTQHKPLFHSIQCSNKAGGRPLQQQTQLKKVGSESEVILTRQV